MSIQDQFFCEQMCNSVRVCWLGRRSLRYVSGERRPVNVNCRHVHNSLYAGCDRGRQQQFCTADVYTMRKFRVCCALNIIECSKMENGVYASYRSANR